MINKLTYERKTAGPLYCLYQRQCNWQLIDFDKAGRAGHHIDQHQHHASRRGSVSVCLFNCCQRQNLLQTASIIIHRKSHTVSVHLYLRVEQGGRSCATARPPVSASAGAPALAGSPSIRAFVAKSVLSRFTCFWMYRFQPFMVMNGYFMIMLLVQCF